jgi:hypothetical protein
MHECTWHGLLPGTGAFERPLDPRLQRAAGDAFAVAPDKQRGLWGPSGEAGACGCRTLFSTGEPAGAAHWKLETGEAVHEPDCYGCFAPTCGRLVRGWRPTSDSTAVRSMPLSQRSIQC